MEFAERVNNLSAQGDYFMMARAQTLDSAGRAVTRNLGAPNLAANPVLQANYTYNLWTVQGGRLQYLKSGTPASFQTTPPYPSLQYLEYAYDLVGNIDWIKDYRAGTLANPQLQDFTYDNLNRLAIASASGGTNGNGDYATENYTYSSTTGNLTSKAGVSYQYNAQVTCPAGSRTLAHAVSTAGSKTFTYDCNGNMTGRNVGSSYNLAYDAENRLTNVSGAATASYGYDGDGKRVKNVNAYQNLAGGAPASSDTTLYNPDVVTNGDTWADSGSGPDREFAYTGAGLHYAQLDLGAVYSVDKVKVWHCAYDGRTYHNTKTQVSEDGVSWYTSGLVQSL